MLLLLSTWKLTSKQSLLNVSDSVPCLDRFSGNPDPKRFQTLCPDLKGNFEEMFTVSTEQTFQQWYKWCMRWCTGLGDRSICGSRTIFSSCRWKSPSLSRSWEEARESRHSRRRSLLHWKKPYKPQITSTRLSQLSLTFYFCLKSIKILTPVKSSRWKKIYNVSRRLISGKMSKVVHLIWLSAI